MPVAASKGRKAYPSTPQILLRTPGALAWKTNTATDTSLGDSSGPPSLIIAAALNN